MEINYLDSIQKQFEYYKLLGDLSFQQLDNEALFWQYNPESNSIAILVNHLAGNMKSRWTDFLSSDGEKTWRNRDAEFEDLIQSRAQLIAKWEEGWTCLFEALTAIAPEHLSSEVYIRNLGHTVIEAINRQLAHYAYHVGQIVFLAKMIKGEDWKSLSIPKGDSQHYNSKKFAKPKHREHFTKEFLDGSFYKKS